VIDDGEAVHYTAVSPGTPVFSSDEAEIGKVEQILDNYREHIFDGVVFTDTDGVLRFADAPDVQRTAERGITLNIDAKAAAELGPPDEGNPSYRPNLNTGRLSKLFGGGWKKQ